MECDVIWVEDCNKYIFLKIWKIFSKIRIINFRFFFVDVNVHSNSWNDQFNHLRIMFENLRIINLKKNILKR